jgi:hypothetical protein
MSNLDNITNLIQYKFFTDVVWIDWYGEKKQFALVSLRKRSNLENTKNNRIKVIHPVSEFLMFRYSTRAYSTMKKHADNLSAFLNYLCESRGQLGIKSLKELKLSHGTQFLNYLGREKGVRRDTIKSYERTITNFYVFLSKKELLPSIPKNKFVKKENSWNKSFYESPFVGINYPTSTPIKKEHAFPMKYFPLFLEISVMEAPRITLGIYLQFMGGLRAGEVVNIKRAEAKRRVKNGDFLLDIKEQHFRSDIKDRSGSGVKRTRTQSFYNIKDWLPTIFHDHIERFKPVDNSNALFVNRDGKPMTAKSYSQYFNKVKKQFCNYLKAYGDEDDIVVADHLRTIDWSTHIGRGTFTNMVAENTDNPFLVAYKRGDSQPESSLPYMAKTTRLRSKIENMFETLNNDYIPKLVGRRERGEELNYEK